MSFKPVSLDEATPAQCRDYATKFLNLEVPSDAKPADIISLIKTAQPSSTNIFIEESDQPEIEHAQESQDAI
jgi:hypothetical protein